MAENYDGDIKLGVSLSPKDVKKSAKELGDSIEKIVSSAAKSGDSKVNKLAKDMAKTASASDAALRKMREMEQTKVSKEFTDTANQVSKLEENLEKALEKAGRLRLRMDMSKQGKSINEQIAAVTGPQKDRESLSDMKRDLELQKKLRQKYSDEILQIEKEREDKLADIEAKRAELKARNAAPVEYQGVGKAAIEAINQQYDEMAEKANNAFNKAGEKIEKYTEKIADVNKQVRELQDEQDKLAQAMGVTGAEVEVAMLEEKLNEANDKLKEMEANGTKFSNSIDTGAYENLKNQVNDLNNTQRIQIAQYNQLVEAEEEKIRQSHEEADAMAEQVASMLRLRLNAEVADESIVQLGQDIREMNKELEQLQQEQAQMEQAGMGLGYQQYDDNIIKIAELKDNIKDAQGAMDEYGNELTEVTSGSKLAALASMGKTIGVTIANGAMKAAKHIASMAKSLIKATAAKIKSGFKTLASHIRGLASASKQSEFNFRKLGRTILTYGLGMRSIITLVNKLRSAIKEGVSNLAQWRDGANDTNKALSAMMSSLTYLRNAWGAAFAPIANVILPWLSKLIDMLASAANAIGAFMAKLTGKSTFIKAKKVQQDYAKSLSGTASAANEAKEALASFDKLEVIQQDKDKGGSGGAGDLNDMFEEVNVDDTLPKRVRDWIDQLKEAWNEGNFFGVGRTIAEGLNEGMQYVDDWFNNVLRPKGVEWAQNFANIFNGIILNLDWTLLGKTVADGLNAIADIINTFLTGVDWLDLGHGIGEAIRSWFENIEWDLIGQTFANKWNVLIDTIYGIVTTPGLFEEIGHSIAEFITNWFGTIHWEMLAGIVSNGINGILNTIETVIDEVPWNKYVRRLFNAINQMIKDIDWVHLGEVFGELFNTAIGMLLTAIRTFDWIGTGKSISASLIAMVNKIEWSDVGKTISEFFSGALDMLLEIDWFTLGTDLGNGIGEMLTNIDWGELILKLAGLIGEMLLGAGAFAFSLVGTVGSELLELAGDFFESIGMDGVAGFFRGYKDAWDEAIELIVGFIGDLVEKIKDFLGIHSPSTVFRDEIGKPLVQGLLSGIKETWDKITDFFGEKLKRIKETFSNGWENIKQTASTKWETIKSTVGSKVESMKSTISSKFSMIKSTIGNKWEEIKSSTSNKLGELKSKVNEKMENIKTMLGNIDWSNIGGSLVNGLKRGIEDKWEGLKTKVGNLADGLTSKLNNVFGINSPSKVWAQVGGYLDEGLWQGLDEGEAALIKKVQSLADIMNDSMDLQIPDVARGSVLPMTQSFDEAINGAQESAQQNTSHDPIQFILNSKILAQAVWDEQEKKYKMYNGYVPATT